MKKASISKVKAELSKFIRMVVKGETVVILDRDRPVAMLSAIQNDQDLEIINSERDPGPFFTSLKRRSYKDSSDILALLDEERSERL